MIPTLRGITEENDFEIFYSAAQSLRDGISMYNGPHLYGMWYYYSPLFASILVPFTFAPLVVLKLSWLFFSLYMLFRIVKLLFQFLGIAESTEGKWFVALLAVVAVHPTFLNLLHGQMTILVLWCCMEGTFQAMQPNRLKSAAAFGLGINIKLLPLFFFYSYFLKRNYKLLIAMSAAVLLFVLIPYLFIPAGFHTELIYGWLDMINPMKAEHLNTSGEGGFIDFASLITKYCTAAPIATEAQLNFANITEHEVFLIQTGFRLLILCCTAFIILKVNKNLGDTKLREFADMAFVLLCIPCAFPHQRDYSILLCVPSFAILLYLWFMKNFRPGLWLTVLVVLAVTAMGSIFFLELFGHRMRVFIYESRLNGIGLLLFIPLYMICVWLYSREKKESF